MMMQVYYYECRKCHRIRLEEVIDGADIVSGPSCCGAPMRRMREIVQTVLPLGPGPWQIRAGRQSTTKRKGS